MIPGRVWLALGALYGGTAVGLGAYAHHGLETEPYLLEAFETGVTYQMWHALALLATGVLALGDRFRGSRLLALAGLLFALGVVLFSGTLYTFGLTADLPVVGAAPVGGVMMMAGWACLALGAVTGR